MPRQVYEFSGMTLAELRALLASQPAAALELVFDDGDTVPPAFHVTEVGHVTRRFIDCGGTRRTTECCLLQVWVAAGDPDHRLPAGKLLDILRLADDLLPSAALPVEIEYEGCVLSQYSVAAGEAAPGLIRLRLEDKHTDCLAKEACGLAPAGACGPGCC
jgi:hypothetical protein